MVWIFAVYLHPNSAAVVGLASAGVALGIHGSQPQYGTDRFFGNAYLTLVLAVGFGVSTMLYEDYKDHVNGARVGMGMCAVTALCQYTNFTPLQLIRVPPKLTYGSCAALGAYHAHQYYLYKDEYNTTERDKVRESERM